VRGSKEVLMKRFTRALAVAVLGAATLALSSPKADAGRIGGPASATATLAAYQSEFVDVPFAVGEPAVVSVVGSGTTNVDVFIYDADGNVSIGVGSGDRKTATMSVYRAGFFRVEVRNTGPTPNTVVVSTN
jgi:hypothetical protein